jgi:putative transposase
MRRAYDSFSDARASLKRNLIFYNGCRLHTALDRRTPDQAYLTPTPLRAA